MTTVTALKWTCAGCRVAVTRSDAEVMPLPEAWEICGDETFCLGCRRSRIAEAAVDSAPAVTDRTARARLRRTAMIEFEISRVPEKTNGAIAKACRSSIRVVAAARRRLDGAGA